MEDFLNKLYNYEYFGTYLMIAIAVLVLLFIIVLFFGKKDQKKREIEETKKLQQINNQDAFKEENNVASVEVPSEVAETPTLTQEKLENDTIIVPNINNISPEMNVENLADATNTETLEVNNNSAVDEIPEPVLPQEELNINASDNMQPSISEIPEPVINPILDKEEEKPLVFNEPVNETPAFNNIESQFVTPEPEMPAPSVQLTDVPDFNFDEIISGVEEAKEETVSKPKEVFSSVYAPEKETIELPKMEEKSAKNDDLDIELPTLKKEVEEEKIEMPVLNDYNLDNISGEDYNINK